MKLYFQYGFQMKNVCLELAPRFPDSAVIISPVNVAVDKLESLCNEFSEVNTELLFDPQMYDLAADHRQLQGYSYWDNIAGSNSFNDDSTIIATLEELRDVNTQACTSKYILPGLYASQITEEWVNTQGRVADLAANILSDKPRYATICLSSDVLRSEEAIEAVIAHARGWPVSGYYLVPEHPNSDYLVTDAIWMSNLLSLSAALKLHCRELIVGYASHQMLSLAAVNVDAIATGNHLNVRSFSTARFFENDEEQGGGGVAIYYYCPHALTEYNLTFLDVAQQANVLSHLSLRGGLTSEFADVLFSGARPTDTNFKLKLSWLHYLNCLAQQCSQSTLQSFDQAFTHQVQLLEDAQARIAFLEQKNVRGGARSFRTASDVNIVALNNLRQQRGVMLRRDWHVMDI